MIPPSVTRLVTGDAVNVAAQARANRGHRRGILIGEDTYSLVKDVVHAEPTEPLLLRGQGRAHQRRIASCRSSRTSR